MMLKKHHASSLQKQYFMDSPDKLYKTT